MQDLINATCLAFGVSETDLLSPKRTDELAQARFAAMLVLRRRNYSFPRIAMILKRDDHTTVIHGVGRALWLEREDEAYRQAVEFIADNSRMEHEAALLLSASEPNGGIAGRPRWEPTDPVAVIKQYEDGASLLALAAAHDVGEATLRKWFARNGVHTQRKGRGRKKEQDPRIPHIMAMREEGATLQQIGDELGVTRERVRQIVVKAGLAKEFAERPATPFEIAVLEEYKAGASLDYVAGKLGVCATTARAKLIESGYQIRPSKKKMAQTAWREKMVAEVLERYRAGENTRDIAKAVGLKRPEQIYRYLALAGIKPNRGPSNREPSNV